MKGERDGGWRGREGGLVSGGGACESYGADAMIGFLSRGSKTRPFAIDSSHPISLFSWLWVHACISFSDGVEGDPSRLIHLVLALDAWLSRHSYIAH